MSCSTPGVPVLHCLLEFAQTHVHWVDDSVQPSHPLSPPSPALNLSQHEGLFQWVGSPALQADSLLSEPPRYWRYWITCKQCLILSLSYIDLWWSVMHWMVGLLWTSITWGSLHVFPPPEKPCGGCDQNACAWGEVPIRLPRLTSILGPSCSHYVSGQASALLCASDSL